jgi:Trk K+ transport system NAD-binding subunit
LGNIGFRVIQELVSYGERAVVIEQSRDSRFVTTARRLGVPVLIGDATVSEVLRQAHVAQARAVIAATSDDLINLEVALMVRELNPLKRVVVHLSDPGLAETLRDAANVRLALSIPSLAAPAFVAALFGDRVHAVFMIEGKMFATVDLTVSADDSLLAGQPVGRVAADYGMLPIVVADQDGTLLAQPLSARLEPGFRFIGISALGDLERLMRREPPREIYEVEVLRFPDAVKPSLVVRLQKALACSPEVAQSVVHKLPFRVGGKMTRGHAEELLASLKEQNVTGTVQRVDGTG